MKTFDPISLEILWSRLIAIADEAAATLVRTAFSTIVYETHDYTCMLLDANGDSLSQSSRSAPSFIGTMPETAKHLLRWFPAETLVPGDVLLTNDPWMGTGHTPDMNVLTPIFHRGRLVAFAGSVSHVVDIGGIPYAASARDVYEEGLRLPPCKLYSAGQRTKLIFDLFEFNTRAPEQVIGDVEALVTANAMGAQRLVDLMEEEGIDDLGPLALAIQSASEQAMRKALRRIPDGDYAHELQLDGFEQPLLFKGRVRVSDGGIWIDYAGSSPQVRRGINSVLRYTYSYTAFGVKSLLDPETPNNQGAFRTIKVTAPEGCFLNPLPPSPTSARNLTGHVLPYIVYGALASVVPDRVAAVGGSAPGWAVAVHGEHDNGRPFSILLFLSGGLGATALRDGNACMSFPGLVANVPAELAEHLAPLRIVSKRLLPDSGGAGRQRGGLGQEVIIESAAKGPIRASIQADRIRTPADGFLGGGPGACGTVLLNGKVVADAKGIVTLECGDRIVLRLPGGGGFGDPAERLAEAIAADRAMGYTS
jgi:N-methylhydantoinase B